MVMCQWYSVNVPHRLFYILNILLNVLSIDVTQVKLQICLPFLMQFAFLAVIAHNLSVW